MTRGVLVDRQASGEYLFIIISYTVNGFRVYDGQPLRLPLSSSDVAIGTVAMEAIGRNRRGLPPFDKNNNWPEAEFLKHVATRSYREYCRGVHEVSVFLPDEGNEITVQLRQSAGRHGGFVSYGANEVTFEYGSPEQLGEAILEGFRHTTAL